MTEEELDVLEVRAANALINAMTPVAEMRARSFIAAVAEIRRLRAELDTVNADRQALWQLYDREIDRIYADAKGIDQ